MTKEWENFWNQLLDKKKLQSIIAELNQVDALNGKPGFTKQICYDVYHNYDSIKKDLTTVKRDLVDTLGQLEQVHLQSGRVKTKESLIEKIIRKRYQYMASQTSGYAGIDGENYMQIITDLAGIRLIVNYRGKWEDIHNEVLKRFPLKDLEDYEKAEHLPHIRGEAFLAELPIVYYAKGDAIEQYADAGLETKEHRWGYRSIHYVISYRNYYVELQVRTIYDEAWSDCDHSYVYKQEAQPNNTALKKLSAILCEITNVANDIGDNMHDIYEKTKCSDTEGSTWKATLDEIDFLNKKADSLHKAEEELRNFIARLEKT